MARVDLGAGRGATAERGFSDLTQRGSATSTAKSRHSQNNGLAQPIAQLQQALTQLQRALSAFVEVSLPGGGAATPGRPTTDAGQPLRRLFPSNYADGQGAPGGADRPSARAISNAVSRADEGKLNKAGASDLFWLWGQFLDHDIDLSVGSDEPLSIDVPKGDASFDPADEGGQTLRTHRSKSVQGVGGTRQQINEITALMDASNIYGSTEAQTHDLRSFAGGRLRASENGYMPRTAQGFFVSGDVRVNENVALTAMHTLFMREHNRVADALKADNPCWSDQQLFTEARAWVTAEMQAITTNEFLPLLLGNDALGAYRGPQSGLDAQVSNAFSTAAYRFGHSMVSDRLTPRNADGSVVGGAPLKLGEAFFRPDTFDSVGPDAILRGLAANTAQAMDPEIVDSLRNLVLEGPGAPKLDLAALNIVRGRDHGLPTLNQARAAFGMPRIPSFDDPVFREGVGARLAEVYDSPEDIDLWVGLMAEAPQGEGLVGPTQRAILVEQFARLRDADPNWYQNTFAPSQVTALNGTTLADVIRRNTDVNRVQANAMIARPLAV